GSGVNRQFVTIDLGDGAGGFITRGDAFASPGNDPYVGLADVNADGKPDLVLASSDSGVDIVLRLGNGDGTFDTPTPPSYSLGTTSDGVAFGDFNGDGAVDAVFPNANMDTVSILL